MHIRYIDRYAADHERRWRILHRTVYVDATEDRQVRGDWSPT
jgi:hypothetical protein